MLISPTPTNTEGPSLEQRVAELEARLAESERALQHYRRIAELAPSVLYVYDLADQRNVYANRELTDLLGYSAEDVQRMGDQLFAILLHQEDWATLIAHTEKLLQASDGEVLELRYRMRHSNGSWHWLSSREVVFARDAAGAPLQKLGAVYDITTQVQRESELIMLKAVVEHSPDGIGALDIQGRQVYANAAMQAMLGYGPELIGMPYSTYIRQEDNNGFAEMMAKGSHQGHSIFQRKDGSTFTGHSTSFAIRDARGEVSWVGGVVRDVTEQQRADEERLALQEQVINAQQAALRELSTPLIPLEEGLVVMPLIGSIDTRRAQQVLEELLRGVAANHARTAILDITGVPVVDTQVAGALLRAAQSVKLLGAQVIITGIRPEIAQTLVGLGLDLQNIITRGSLQSGISHALGR